MPDDKSGRDSEHSSNSSILTEETLNHSFDSKERYANNDSSPDDNMAASLQSEKTELSDDTAALRDMLPKSFLQLQGISIGNFNMGCNFNIAAAISIMISYDLMMLAIQEHTPWNRTLSDGEKTSIERHCDKWGYFVYITKLQIIIFDKRIQACHRETNTYEDGRIAEHRFAISDQQHVTFIPVYGIPHCPGNMRGLSADATTENEKIQQMTALRDKLKNILHKAKREADITYVLGDLQDTPDNSNVFHYGSCRIAKHPLGIVRTCENEGLFCSMYQHIENQEKPIVSRHGTKGGRFIDGTYTCAQGLTTISGITIVKDTGINSDHDLVISKVDLGIEQLQVSKDKEERINFKKIMNIPVHIGPGDDHPTLNTTVYKGSDFQLHADLYTTLQQVVEDPTTRILARITEIADRLQTFENDIITRTRLEINEQEQKEGKLLQRTAADADRLNSASQDFFTLVHDLCREADLASHVPIIPGGKQKII